MGQSASIVEDCKAKDVFLTQDLCEIKFGTSLAVDQFGNIAKGQLEPNTDLAGRGALIAFAVPGGIVCGFAVILALSRLLSFFLEWQKGHSPFSKTSGDDLSGRDWSDWLHETFDDLICASGDAQLLLILAYGSSFKSRSQCEVSGYHFMLAIYTILTGLSTSLLGMLLVRNVGKKYLSGLLRVAIFIICLVGVFQTLVWQNGARVLYSQKIPGSTQVDSPLVLPAYCTLDTTFDPYGPLTGDQTRHITPNGLPNNAKDQLMVIMLAFVLVAILKYIFAISSRDIEDRHQGKMFIGVTLLKFVFWGIALGITIWNWATIMSLRDWAADSGWLKMENGNNEEQDIQGLGQVAPLIALGAIGFTLTDTISEVVKKKWNKNRHSANVNNVQGGANGGSFQMHNLGATRQGYARITTPLP